MSKKIILSGLLSLAVTSSAYAGTAPTVTVGADTRTSVAYTSQKKDFRYTSVGVQTRNTEYSNTYLPSETTLKFGAEGQIGNNPDAKWKMNIRLNADASAAKNGDTNQAEQTYAAVESKQYGTMEFGTHTGASYAMQADAGVLTAFGSGGSEGDWHYYINQQDYLGLDINRTYLVKGDLYANNSTLVGIKGVNAANLTYYTPEYKIDEQNSIKAGITYKPDTELYGTIFAQREILRYVSADAYDDNFARPIFKDVFDGGIQYSYESNNGVAATLAVTGQTGRPKDPYSGAAFKKLQAAAVSGGVRYKGVVLAFLYGSNGKSGLRVDTIAGNTTFWNAGIAYNYGIFGVGVTYSGSKRGVEDQTGLNRSDRLSFTAESKLAEGAAIFVDVTGAKFKDKSGTDPIVNNKAVVSTAGMKLTF